MAFEVAIFGLPYFDPAGLIIAEVDGKIVGFIHAGFGFTEDRNEVDYSKGIICWLIVHEESRQKGIGLELVRRAEEYLKSKGATTLQAGQSRGRDPFYFGLYGGARCSGFLESDETTGPFLEKLGYHPSRKATIYQKDLRASRDPMNIKLMALRRKTELRVSEQPEDPTMWWLTHLGNIESMYFTLHEKKSGIQIASLSIVGLDHYISRWKERVIGIVDLFVEPDFREQGYGTTLVVESIRRLRNDFITRAEIHVPENYISATKAIEASGFDAIDTGVVYER